MLLHPLPQSLHLWFCTLERRTLGTLSQRGLLFPAGFPKLHALAWLRVCEATVKCPLECFCVAFVVSFPPNSTSLECGARPLLLFCALFRPCESFCGVLALDFNPGKGLFLLGGLQSRAHVSSTTAVSDCEKLCVNRCICRGSSLPVEFSFSWRLVPFLSLLLAAPRPSVGRR